MTGTANTASATTRFGDVLKRIRAVRDLSGREVSRRAGLPGSAVSRYENGSARPRPAALRKLADVLGVPAELLSWFAYAELDANTSDPVLFDRVEQLMLEQVEMIEADASA